MGRSRVGRASRPARGRAVAARRRGEAARTDLARRRRGGSGCAGAGAPARRPAPPSHPHLGVTPRQVWRGEPWPRALERSRTLARAPGDPAGAAHGAGRMGYIFRPPGRRAGRRGGRRGAASVFPASRALGRAGGQRPTPCSLPTDGDTFSLALRGAHGPAGRDSRRRGGRAVRVGVALRLFPLPAAGRGAGGGVRGSRGDRRSNRQALGRRCAHRARGRRVGRGDSLGRARDRPPRQRADQRVCGGGWGRRQGKGEGEKGGRVVAAARAADPPPTPPPPSRLLRATSPPITGTRPPARRPPRSRCGSRTAPRCR